MNIQVINFEGHKVKLCAIHRNSKLYFTFDSLTEESVLDCDNDMNYEEDGYRIILELEYRGYYLPNKLYSNYNNFDYLSIEDEKKGIY